MVMKAIISGFFTKLITGFDDTVTQVPLIANITKTRKGKLSFMFGIFLAVTAAIILSFMFARILKGFRFYNVIAAGLIFFLAFAIAANLFLPKTKKKTEEKIKKAPKPITKKRILKLMGIGFIAAFITVIDDSLAYSSLFLATDLSLFAILGIYLALFLELFVILYFSRQISKIKYKKKISVAGLIILGFLILFRVI